MTRRIVQCLSHAIESYDMLRLHHSNGYEVVDIGPYIDPAHPHVDMRPPAPEVPLVPVIKDAVDTIGAPDNIAAAQEHLPDAVLEWADTLIYHHYMHRLFGDWPRIRDWMRGDSNRRVIWRSIGQSVDGNEHDAKPFMAEGMERVAYSPKEANIPGYTGHTALIRFGKDPAEWTGWTGTGEWVANVTQNLKGRDPWTHYGFWQAATEGLAVNPAGPGSEEIGGAGALPYEVMRGYLVTARCYLYMGTQPASYTLGFIEALMTGTPVVAMGPGGFAQPIFPYVPEMYEAHEIAEGWSDDPADAREGLRKLLDSPILAAHWSSEGRKRAIELFGIDTIREQWRVFLG